MNVEDVDHEAEQFGSRARAQDPLRARRRDRAWGLASLLGARSSCARPTAGGGPLDRGSDSGVCRPAHRRSTGLVPEPLRAGDLAPATCVDACARGWAGRRGRWNLPTRPASQLRDPSFGRRRGLAHDPGVARPLEHLDNPGLHSGRVRQIRDAPTRAVTLGPDRREKTLETNVKAIELRELWRRYKNDGDPRARERLVVAYSPLVKYVAGRTAAGLPPHVEEADLVSYGLVGLISAIERFDISREIKFETYAITRIKGAIIDELRSIDWVPRSVQGPSTRNRARQYQARAPSAAHSDR